MYKLAVSVSLLSMTSLAAPILSIREVPQEHSHERFVTSVRASLTANNPAGLGDPIFALLGDAAAVGGVGQSGVTPQCVQQAIADQAFTNAKAANDIEGMTGALAFRALERNTGAVGQKSLPCGDVATNPEIAAISQHQDPASDGAALANKQITLALAKEIAAVGGDPSVALQSGTFAPGQIGDPTAKGNSCDDEDCIFLQNLLVEDASPEEIQAAIGGQAQNVQASPSQDHPPTRTANADSQVTITATICAAPSAPQPEDASNSQPVDESTQAAVASNEKGLDFGTCTDPSIKFAQGLDGRKETAFEPNDKSQFNHGSAQKIGIISTFICDRLASDCKASAATVQTCRDASTEAAALGAVGSTADTFNAALGFSTNFASVQAFDDQGRAVA